jgi:hypothetical protein
MRARDVAWWLVVLCGANVVATGRSHSTSIRGHIVAFRPAERIGQAVSGVVNREAFLLRVDGKAGEVVKVLYEHDGYSEILDTSNEMVLGVHRDRSCDVKYGQFVSEAPVLASEDKTNSVPPVTMLGGVDGLPPSYQLNCYRLHRGDIHNENKP